MKQRYSEVNFFTTTLSSGATLTPAASWRTLIPLYSLPAISDNKYFHVIYKPTDIINRAIYRAHNEWGNCYIDNIDVSLAKTFITKSQVAIFDVAEMFNDIYKNVDDFGLVELFLSNNAKIRWGYVNFMGSNTLISDSAIATLANGTWYAILDFTDSTLKFVSTFDGSTQYKFGTVVVTTGVGVYTDNRALDIHKNRSVLDKFTESGGNVLFNGVPIWGWAGTGDVIGPAGWVVDGDSVVFDWPTGKIVKKWIWAKYTTKTTKTDWVVYQASGKWGMVVAWRADWSATLQVLSDGSNPPIAVVAQAKTHETWEWVLVSVPILPDMYYKVVNSAYCDFYE